MCRNTQHGSKIVAKGPAALELPQSQFAGTGKAGSRHARPTLNQLRTCCTVRSPSRIQRSHKLHSMPLNFVVCGIVNHG